MGNLGLYYRYVFFFFFGNLMFYFQCVIDRLMTYLFLYENLNTSIKQN